MRHRSSVVLGLGAVVAVAALPAPASAASMKACEGIGSTITKLRAKGIACDDARTLAAKWAETVASGSGAGPRIDGYRCSRTSGAGVRCTKGRSVVTFRARLP